jgi:hypothetical protein
MFEDRVNKTSPGTEMNKRLDAMFGNNHLGTQKEQASPDEKHRLFLTKKFFKTYFENNYLEIEFMPVDNLLSFIEDDREVMDLLEKELKTDKKIADFYGKKICSIFNRDPLLEQYLGQAKKEKEALKNYTTLPRQDPYISEARNIEEEAKTAYKNRIDDIIKNIKAAYVEEILGREIEKLLAERYNSFKKKNPKKRSFEQPLGHETSIEGILEELGDKKIGKDYSWNSLIKNFLPKYVEQMYNWNNNLVKIMTDTNSNNFIYSPECAQTRTSSNGRKMGCYRTM